MNNPWIRTATGRDLYLNNPGPSIDIIDVAEMLAKTNRFNGASREPYSVAQHSVWIVRTMMKHEYSTAAQLYGLLHDAPEYILGDMASPVKKYIFGEPDGRLMISSQWEHAHNFMMTEILHALGLPAAVNGGINEVVHHFDMKALRTEFRDLMPGPEPDYFKHLPEPDPGRIIPNENWRTSREVFLTEFDRLMREWKQESGQ